MLRKKQVGLVEEPVRKILTLSDIHFPFALVDELQKAIELHSDADVVVLNGDILDGYIFSTYGTAKRIAALKEYIAAFNLVKQLHSFPRLSLSVVIMTEDQAKALLEILSRKKHLKSSG